MATRWMHVCLFEDSFHSPRQFSFVALPGLEAAAYGMFQRWCLAEQQSCCAGNRFHGLR